MKKEMSEIKIEELETFKQLMSYEVYDRKHKMFRRLKDVISSYDFLTKCYKIETVLQIWEILKKHLYMSDESLSIIMDDLRDADDFNKIKVLLK